MATWNDWPETKFRCNGGAGCVIVEVIAGTVVIRDGKNPTQPGLVFSPQEYAAFRRRVLGASWLQLLLGDLARMALRAKVTLG